MPQIKKKFDVGPTKSLRLGTAGRLGGAVVGFGAVALNVDSAANLAPVFLRKALNQAYENAVVTELEFPRLQRMISTNPVGLRAALRRAYARKENE